MNIFNLPDLGEGLPDAEIHEWFVKEGDTVALDQPLVSMETAKAVVDVPCPQAGIIVKLYGKPGDVIQTGAPLVEFKSETIQKADKGTVVGNLEESQELSEDHFVIGSSQNAGQSTSSRAKATPMVRQLAKKLNVDLNALQGSGEHGLITKTDVEKAAQGSSPSKTDSTLEEGYQPLRGTRRTMLHSMEQSHREVVPVSIFDEADISAWAPNEDITVRLIQALSQAVKKEPALNAWFNAEHGAVKSFKELHLGLAMDTEDGLFVPVIPNADRYSAKELRNTINEYKAALKDRSLKADKFKGATLTLSNFGKFAGLFASPIIVPPMVAILAVGKRFERLCLNKNNNDNAKVEAHQYIPLSLSFDHRAATGGEATRFLGEVIRSLENEKAE